MKSQHNLSVLFRECLVLFINSGYLQGHRAPMAHQTQPLVFGRRRPCNFAFVYNYVHTIHAFTLQLVVDWNLIRLHRIIAGRLILDGFQEGFNARARLLRKTEAADEATQQTCSQCLVQVAHSGSKLRGCDDLSNGFCVGRVG